MREQIHRHPWRFWLAGIMIVVWLGPFPSALLAEGRPPVHVAFNFEGDIFEEFFTAEQLQDVSSHAADRFIELAGKRRGFLEWTRKTPCPEGRAAACWAITLKQWVREVPLDSGGSSEGWIVTLEHSWRQGDQFRTFPQPEETKTVYPFNSSSIPLGRPEALKTDLVNHLDNYLPDLFELEEDGKKLVDQFLNNIPIADRVIADASLKALILPIKHGDLKATRMTKLKVDLQYGPGSLYSQGWLLLDAASAVREGDPSRIGQIKGKVTEVTIDPMEVAPLPTWWNPQFPQAIDSATDIRVYMVRYDQLLEGSATVSNGAVLLPAEDIGTSETRPDSGSPEGR